MLHPFVHFNLHLPRASALKTSTTPQKMCIMKDINSPAKGVVSDLKDERTRESIFQYIHENGLPDPEDHEKDQVMSDDESDISRIPIGNSPPSRDVDPLTIIKWINSKFERRGSIISDEDKEKLANVLYKVMKFVFIVLSDEKYNENYKELERLMKESEEHKRLTDEGKKISTSDNAFVRMRNELRQSINAEDLDNAVTKIVGAKQNSNPGQSIFDIITRHASDGLIEDISKQYRTVKRYLYPQNEDHVFDIIFNLYEESMSTTLQTMENHSIKIAELEEELHNEKRLLQEERDKLFDDYKDIYTHELGRSYNGGGQERYTGWFRKVSENFKLIYPKEMKEINSRYANARFSQLMLTTQRMKELLHDIDRGTVTGAPIGAETL